MLLIGHFRFPHIQFSLAELHYLLEAVTVTAFKKACEDFVKRSLILGCNQLRQHFLPVL
ncbi:hypothetical protein D3C87_2059930 [compost metagenome]